MVIIPFLSLTPDIKEERASPWLMAVKKKLGSGVSLKGSSEKPKNLLYMGFPGYPWPGGHISGQPAFIIRSLFPGTLLFLLFLAMTV
jgi:hypothetical protein